MRIDFKGLIYAGPFWLILSGNCLSQSLFKQVDKDKTTYDSINRHLVNSSADSINQVRDSLELVVLTISKTYAHIEEILQCVPVTSNRFDLLPSVLPINVPLEFFRVSSPFGVRRHPVHKQMRFHGGIDVKARAGMPVKATAKGWVVQVGFDPALGAFVRLQHAFGFETVYGHLQGYCVKPGQFVELNQEIGKVGKTGISTGPHLHYVIKKNGSAIDPFDFCFLLRRRLWLYERSKVKGTSTLPVPAVLSLSSKGA